jgi:hypothetical protein
MRLMRLGDNISPMSPIRETVPEKVDLEDDDENEYDLQTGDRLPCFRYRIA